MPASSWTGTAGSGFGGAVPMDPVRTSAKPVIRPLQPADMWFTDDLRIGVWAAANDSGSLLNNLGLKKVILHYEGAKVEIQSPTIEKFSDSNGVSREYFGWWATISKPSGKSGSAQVYWEAVPNDSAMQNRVIGPFHFNPQEVLHDYVVEVAPSQSEIANKRYRSLLAAVNDLVARGAQNPLITIVEPFEGDLPSFAPYAGASGYFTISATAPVRFRKQGISTGISAALRARVDGIWFKGSNISFDLYMSSGIFHEKAGNRSHVFDGVRFIDSGGRDYQYLLGAKPVYGISRNDPYFLECSVNAIPDACNNAALVRGCDLTGGHRDAATGAACVIGCTISDWTSGKWRDEIPALTVQYLGQGSATLEYSLNNDDNNRFFTAKVDGSVVSRFEVRNQPKDYEDNTNYTVANVVNWLNSLAGWRAVLLDNTRRASVLTKIGTLGRGFSATDVSSGVLTLYTMWDEHTDIWQWVKDAENIAFVNNRCWGNWLQSVFLTTPTGIKDCMIVGNAFSQDEVDPRSALKASQLSSTQSHVVLAQNSWSNQPLVLRNDLTYAPDSYCLIANNVLPEIRWSKNSNQTGVAIVNNHLFAGKVTPARSTGTTMGGDASSLFEDPARGLFTPRGELLANRKRPALAVDIRLLQFKDPSPAGAMAA